MDVQLKPWGNSYAFRIPKEILKTAGFKPEDVFDISASSGRISITAQHRHKTLEERVAAYGGKLCSDGEFDWGEDVGREAW